MKILIVEDDFTARCLLQEILKPYGDCHVAVNGKEALEAFRDALDEDKPYDLLCLDIMMPEMNGHETLKAVRAEEIKRDIHGLDGVKVIMTTALSDPKNIMRSFREQCEAYVTKPIDTETLLKEIKALGFQID